MLSKLNNTLCRLWGWWLVSLLASVGIAWFAPQQIGVLVYKVLQVVLGINIAYLADRELFRNVPPIDTVSHDAFGAARLLSRALIAVAVLLSLSIGL